MVEKLNISDLGCYNKLKLLASKVADLALQLESYAIKCSEEIKNNIRPKPIKQNRMDFRCQKLCHFYKNNWPGTNTTMCQHVEGRLHAIGYKETLKECTKEGFNIGYYEAPG